MLRRHVIQTLAGLPLIVANRAWAQRGGFPDRLVKLVVPWPPGGATDAFARLVGQELAKDWGQSVIVENRPGASGNIGAAHVAASSPDGYTFMLGTISLASNPSLYVLPFDVLKAFAPISLVASVPHVLAVAPSLPAHNVKELIALAKASPGKLNYSSAGVGSPFHLAAELFNVMAGVKISHIPYSGGGPAVQAVLGGQVEMTFANAVAVMPQVKSGRLRALGITSAKRSPAFPEIVPIGDTVPGYDFASWFGFLMPAGGPPDIVQKMNQDILRVLNLPEVRRRLNNDGADIIASSPAAFATYLASECRKWAQVLKKAGIRPQ